MNKHNGSCHCGDVRYEAELDASQGSKCNCSVCTKLGASGCVVKPDAVRVVQGEDKLASFTRFPEIGTRFYCARCHVYLFSKGHLAELGGDFISVNLNTIDGWDPAEVTYEYWDGRHDNWQAGTRATPWPVRAAG